MGFRVWLRTTDLLGVRRSWRGNWRLPDGAQPLPNAYAWPTHEACWNLGGWPMLEEFTVDVWAPSLLVWSCLAARPIAKSITKSP